MYIQRALFLLILIVVIFMPSWMDWAVASPKAWYRPHLLWFGAVLLIYIGERRARQ